MSRVLVLGANGFIGSHLVDSLADAGYNVRAFGRYGSSDINFTLSEKVELFQGDFLSKADITSALEGVEYVFHFLSTSTPVSTDNDPFIDIETNVRMSVELFQACVTAKVKRIIYASSGGAIYGVNENNRPTDTKTAVHKETDPLYPVSPYAIGKLTIERYLKYFKLKHGLSSLVLRISNPYGERQPFYRKQGVIPIFLEKIYRGEPISVMGDGNATRDYIYVKDLTRAIVDMLKHDLRHDVYNIGSGETTSINELIRLAENVSGKKANVQYVEMPITYVKDVSLDITRITNDIGAIVSVPLQEGMAITYRYIEDYIEKNRHEDGLLKN